MTGDFEGDLLGLDVVGDLVGLDVVGEVEGFPVGPEGEIVGIDVEGEVVGTADSANKDRNSRINTITWLQTCHILGWLAV